LEVVGMTTLEQRQEALNMANDVRLANAALRTELKGLSREDALRRAAHVVLTLEGSSGSMKVESFLASIRGIGPQKVKAMLVEIQCFTPKRLRDLSQRQRDLLADVLVGIANKQERWSAWQLTQTQ
jgi:hypothetical protein